MKGEQSMGQGKGGRLGDPPGKRGHRQSLVWAQNLGSWGWRENVSEIKSQGKVQTEELGGLGVASWGGTRAMGRRSCHNGISLG